jgi:hypothetical protein
MNKFKNRLKYFMECYFNQTFGFDELDELILEFKKIENNLCKELFIQELLYFIETKKYLLANRILRKHGDLDLKDLGKVEKFITYLYDKLLDNPTGVKATDFIKKCRVVFCPVCTPEPEKVMEFGIIDKATVIANNIEIYICKPCKLVWLDENDIRLENAVGYKKFMKTNGLKGFWNELKDIDVL